MPTAVPTARPVSPLPVLIVCANAARVDAVQQALVALTVQARCEVVDGVLQAVRRTLRNDLELAVVDLAVEGAGGAALLRHLSRLRPDLQVLAFGTVEEGTAAPGGARESWPWQDMPSVLALWWFGRAQATAERP